MNHMKQTVEDELKRGYEATSQLRSLLAEPQVKSDDENHQERSKFSNERILTENYSNTIINSFDTSIAILQKIVQSMEMKASSSSVVKTTNAACTTKSRSQTIETSDLSPDGYIWRKYGKKSINNTKYPKDYYRCTYKDDKKCEAIKHVQKISDDPTRYKIMYYAQHTCQTLLNNNNKPSFKIFDSNEKDCTNFTISFESKNSSSLNTQNINHVALTPSSSSIDFKNPSLTTNHPLPDALASTTTIIEPTLVDDAAYFNCPEELYSPTLFLSPNYYMTSSIAETLEDYSLTMMSDSLDANDALWQDLPLWD